MTVSSETVVNMGLRVDHRNTAEAWAWQGNPEVTPSAPVPAALYNRTSDSTGQW